MVYYGYRRHYWRHHYRGGGAIVSNTYHSLKVPPSIYQKLKDRFSRLNRDEDVVFLTRYRKSYGESAYAYLLKTYRRTTIDGRYQMGATPSGKTLERILQLVPTVMTTDERFALFEEIINYNEPENAQQNYSSIYCNNQISYEFSYEDWGVRGRNSVISAIKDIEKQAFETVDYAAKYDFSDIAWLLDNDIKAFCQLIEQTRKCKIHAQIQSAIDDVNLLEKKWCNLQSGKLREERHSELKYQFELGGRRVCLTIFDAEERLLKRAREKRANLLSNIGCLSAIIILVLIGLLAKK